MADAETPRQELPEGEWTAPNSESGVVSIAISEENLAALLGGGKSAPTTAPPVRAAEIPATLGPLSVIQEKPVAEPSPVAAPVLPKRSETVDSTLALFAAIKESRAEALKAEALAKPAAAPEIAPAPAAPSVEPAVTRSAAPVAADVPVAAPTATPAPRFKGTVFPASAGQPTQIPTWAAQRPAASSGLAGVFDKIPGGKKTVLIAGVVIAIGGVGAGLLTRNRGAAKSAAVSSAPTAAPTVNNFPLQLRATPEGSGYISLRWNPQSTLIGQAREGRLVITEGNQKPRTVPVSLDQLKFGQMSYQAQAERVEIRLEVVDPSGAVAEESILAQVPPSASTASAAVSQQNPVVVPTQAPSQAPVTPFTPAPTATPVAPPAEEAPKVARPAARPFTPPANQRPTSLGAIEAPPSLADNSNSNLQVPMMGAQVPRVAPPPPSTPVPAPQQVQVADTIQAANLVKRVTPIYPTIAKTARIQGTVRFNAVISTSGQIRNLEVLSGPPQLRQAASDAVRQWIYRPMLRNGRPVEVVTQIDVNFTLN